jgi:hypothetical protein
MDSNQGRSWSDVDGLGTQGTLTIMKETHTTPGELRANHAQVFVGLAALLELYVKDHELPWSDQSRVRLQEFLPWAAQTLGPLSLPERETRRPVTRGASLTPASWRRSPSARIP